MIRQPSLLRRLIQRSWQIVLLTLVMSIALVSLIFAFVQPTYEATSLLRIEPPAPNLVAPSNGQENRTDPQYLQTQLQLIKSDLVLQMALANPLISNLPSIRESDDPKTELRGKLSVEIVPDSYLIRVSLISKNPTEAAVIVKAVVDSYKAHQEQYAQTANKRLRESLEREEQMLQQKINAVQNQLKEFVQNGKVGLPGAKDLLYRNNDLPQRPFKNFEQEHYQGMIAELMKTESQLIEAESNLAMMEKLLETGQATNADQGLPADVAMNALIEAEFKKDPEVVGLIGKIMEAHHQLERIKEEMREPHDGALLAVQKDLGKLMEKYEDLWKINYEEIYQRLTSTPSPSPVAIRELRHKVAVLKDKKERQTKIYEHMDFKNMAANMETLQSTMLSHTLGSLQARQDRVTDQLWQLEFESKQESFRVVLVDRASVPKSPTTNSRPKLMAATPAIVFLLIFGLFFALEIIAGRSARSVDLSSARLRAEASDLLEGEYFPFQR